MEDYCIRYVNLPTTVRGVTACADGFYNVYINAYLSYEEQQKAIKHGLKHIKRNDFYSDAPIEEIENI